MAFFFEKTSWDTLPEHRAPASRPRLPYGATGSDTSGIPEHTPILTKATCQITPRPVKRHSQRALCLTALHDDLFF
jgi:hypothetical protein